MVTGELDGGTTVHLQANDNRPAGNRRTCEVQDEDDPAQECPTA